MKRFLLIAFMAVIAFLIISSVRNVGEDEVYVTGSAGDRREFSGGIYVHVPFSRARKYSLLKTYDLSGDNALRLRTATRGEVVLEGEAAVAIERAKVLEIDGLYGEEYFAKVVLPIVERETRRYIAQGYEDTPHFLTMLSAAVVENVNSGIAPQGLSISSLEFTSMEREGDISARISRDEGLKVFILGLDGLDWSIYDQVVRTHPLPNLKRVRDGGTWGDLRSIEPLISPLIWTTMVTGVTADLHGITDFLVTSPQTGEDVPVTSYMRRVPALWNMCTASGMSSGFVGWFASFPAEEVNGFVVSDRVAYHMFDPAWQRGEGDRTAAGLTYPPGLFEEIADLVVQPEDITDMVSLYVEGPVGRLKSKFDPADPVSSLRLVISAYQTYEAVVNRLYPSKQPDLFGVYFEFTDSVCHLFMKYMEPAMASTDAEDVARYRYAVHAAYVEADRILGDVLDMLDEDTVLMVMSDHGFKSGDIRPLSDSRIGHGQAIDWHRVMGSIAFYGPGVKKGHEIHNATVLDIAPTILYVLGLPLDEKMGGRVLMDAFREEWVGGRAPRYTSLYDSVYVRSDPTAGGAVSDALKQKLVSLGYVSGGETSTINLATFYHKNRRYREAIEVWQKVIDGDPGNLGARVGLAGAYFEVGREDSAILQLDTVLEADPGNHDALVALATIHVKMGRGAEALEISERAIRIKPDDGESHFNRALALEILGRTDEAMKEYRETVKYAPDHAEAHANLVQLYLAYGRVEEAMAAGEKAVGLASGQPEIHYVYGQALDSHGDYGEAMRNYSIAIELDSTFAPAYIGAASALMRRGKPDSVITICDTALRNSSAYLDYIHSLKGSAYLSKGRTREAERELKRALEYNKSYIPARLNLARLYIGQGKNDAAGNELNIVLTLDPTNAEARELLKRVSR